MIVSKRIIAVQNNFCYAFYTYYSNKFTLWVFVILNIGYRQCLYLFDGNVSDRYNGVKV